MLIQKMVPESYPFDLGTPIETKKLKYIWCNDGWCYIPEIKQRHKHLLRESQIELQQEPWEGVIPLPLHVEEVTRVTYCQAPQVWKEQIGEFCELYVEQITNQSNHKKTRARQAAQQLTR